MWPYAKKVETVAAQPAPDCSEWTEEYTIRWLRGRALYAAYQGDFFSICPFHDLMAWNDPTPGHALLVACHCVHWRDMPHCALVALEQASVSVLTAIGVADIDGILDPLRKRIG